MADTVAFHMTLPRWQAREICRLTGGGVQHGVRVAVSMLLSEGRRSSRASSFIEVQVMPRRGSAVDSMLQILAAGAPTLGDLAPGGKHLDPSLVRAVNAALPSKTARRLLRRLQGATITAIGKEEGVTKQAVHKSLRQAQAMLVQDHQFLACLCELFPASDLTPAILQEMRHAR